MKWRQAVLASRATSVTTAAKVAALGLYEHMDWEGREDPGGNCRPSLDTLARECGTTRPAIARALQRLDDAGFIYRSRGGGRTHVTHYEATLPTDESREEQSPEEQSPEETSPAETDTGETVSEPSETVSEPGSKQSPAETRPTTTHQDPKEPRHDSPASPDPDVSDDARELCNFFVTEHCKPNEHGVPSKGSKPAQTWLVEMDRLVRIGPPNVGKAIEADRIRAVITFMASHRGSGDFPGWSAVVESVPKFRKQFTKISKAMDAAQRNGQRPEPSKFAYSGEVTP